MKRCHILLLSCLLLLPLSLWGEVKIDCFARAECDRSIVYAGDSCVVSLVLYANAPFEKVECATKASVKGAQCRKLDARPARAGQRILENGRRYYVLLWSRYMVKPESEKELAIPEFKFDCTFRLYENSGSPFAGFFGIPAKYKDIKQSIKSPKTKIEVKKKPRRSTQEMMRSGNQVL